MVAPADAGYEAGHGGMLDWQVGMSAEAAGHLPSYRQRSEIGNKSQEVAAVRVEPSKERRISLAAQLPAEIANRLERDHEPDVVTAVARRFRVHSASLPVRHKKWRFLVDKGYEAHGHRRRDARERRGKFQQPRHAACVVIGARAARHSVVVCADDKDLIRPCRPQARCFEIGALDSANGIELRRDLVPLTTPCRAYVTGSRGKSVWTKDVTFSDLGGERVYVTFDRQHGRSLRRSIAGHLA